FSIPRAWGTGSRVFRGAHHTLLAAGIGGTMFANTTHTWRQPWSAELDLGFRIVCFFSSRAGRVLRRGGVGDWRPRNATVIATQCCTRLALDIVDFRELLSRQPDLARIVHEEERRLAGA